MGLNGGNRERFKEAPWYDEKEILKTPILIGGVGGIGSYVSFYLGRIGFPLYLFDIDTVEASNLGGQLYGTQHIGKLKTEAMKSIILDFCDFDNVSLSGRYTSEYNPVMIACFDNMKSRKAMFETWRSQEDRVLLIEARMGTEYGEVYFVIPGSEEKYEATLFNDDEVEDAPCSYKATSHNGAILGGLITSGLLNHIANALIGDFRTIPFSINYELPLLTYNYKL